MKEGKHDLAVHHQIYDQGDGKPTLTTGVQCDYRENRVVARRRSRIALMHDISTSDARRCPSLSREGLRTPEPRRR